MIRLVVFDVDGTLTVHTSIWWRLHQLFGTEETGKRYYDMYFDGQITYDEWAVLDAALWKGQPLAQVLEAVERSQLTPGAEETLQILREHGVHTAVLSGGLDVLADHVARRLGIEYVLTNHLGHRDGVLTGEVDVQVGWDGKVDGLRRICEHFGTALTETAFVGDGLNDVPVFSVAGLAIAFRPRDEQVARAAHVVIRQQDLRLILPHIIPEYRTGGARTHTSGGA